ncbi:BZ3500_MvSof-1268-A1-R1_Chr2-1g04301 [Microbotryum saponariae]|uniref:short-chain 2-methylacyl-CoA dehydrogenase n=1 Tax=Microbotryum saponariae TaxID=289078 RepID=A0A2X0KYN1_9BASI|nr:BZ3500_MvSof-1268-A1-R1_Chr2-1g04301 [Microbotryum saponariae]SCZ91372.1 BZ3501_MvSof-1269-A2-R1_Chr2-1g03957 [Microbotryum saponariae]
MKEAEAGEGKSESGERHFSISSAHARGGPKGGFRNHGLCICAIQTLESSTDHIVSQSQLPEVAAPLEIHFAGAATQSPSESKFVAQSSAGASFTSAILVIEELAKVDPSVSVLCDVHNTLVNTILRHYATPELREKYMPQLSADKLGSFCLSEPNSGSDAFALKTTATKSADGSHYVINGSKSWITNSAEAGLFLVFATSDASKGYKGISCFLVEKEMGVEIAKKEKKLGIRASSTCTLNFDNVKVPAANLIGEEGKGYKIAIEILNEGRVGIAGQMVGLAQGAFNKAVPYTFQRQQFGQAVGSFQGMQMQFAEIATEIEAARLLTYNAARLKEEGQPFTKQAAMAKWYASVVAQKASGAAIEWAGGVGFTREVGIEKFWRDSKIGAIYEGTSNIQLLTIGELGDKRQIGDVQ